MGRDKILPEELVRSFKNGPYHPYQNANYALWKYPGTEHSPTYSSSTVIDETLYRQVGNPYSSVPYEYSYSSPRQQPYLLPQSYYSQNGSHEYLSNSCTPSTSTNTISSLSFSQDNKSDLNLPTFQWSGSGYMAANM